MTTKKELTQEIATVDRDLNRPAVYGGLLWPVDDTLITRGQGKGLKLYDDIERDCHAYAVLQKRKMAVIARERIVLPASDRLKDKKAAAFVEAQIKAIPFDLICVNLLDAILKGFAVGEVIWKATGDGIQISGIKPRDQRRFIFNVEGQPRLLTPEQPMDGIPLPGRKFIVHRFGSKNDDPYGLGLGTRLFWPVWFKRQGITFWLTFADKFGNPTAVGKYGANHGDADQKKLLAALQALASDSGIIIPEGMELDLLEAQRSGSINTHETLCRYMDEQISEAVLGETLSTNVGKTGSYAASQTHNDVREELTKADADLLSDTLNNTLIRWIVDLNMPGADAPTVWRDFEEPEDMVARSSRDKTIHDMGFDPTQDYIDETYGPGWEKRKDSSYLAWGRDTLSKPPSDPQPAFADPAPLQTDAIDDLADQLDQVAGPALDDLIGQIKALVGSAQSLDEVAEKLVNLYPDLDATALGQAMGQAMLVADLTGRSEILDAKP